MVAHETFKFNGSKKYIANYRFEITKKATLRTFHGELDTDGSLKFRLESNSHDVCATKDDTLCVHINEHSWTGEKVGLGEIPADQLAVCLANPGVEQEPLDVEIKLETRTIGTLTVQMTYQGPAIDLRSGKKAE